MPQLYDYTFEAAIQYFKGKRQYETDTENYSYSEFPVIMKDESGTMWNTNLIQA